MDAFEEEEVDEEDEDQLRRHTRACQSKCPDRNTYALAAALAV